jgi:hypothetical protein
MSEGGHGMLKQICRFYLKLNGDWAERAGFLAGFAFFLRIVYYFGFMNIGEISFWGLLIGLILPMGVWIAFMVLMRGFRLNAPGLYALILCGFCLLTVLESFTSGMSAHIVLSVLCYPVLGALLIGTTGGYLDSKNYLAIASMVILVLRFLIFDVNTYLLSFSLISFIPEVSTLCGIGVIFCLAMSLKKRTIE